MTLTEKVNKFLGFSKQFNFKTDKLKDSEITIQYDMVVDAPVMVSSATGSEVATDGDYTTQSGDSFKVVGGKVSEILEQAPVEEEVAVEELATVEEDKPVEDAQVADDKEAKLQAKIDELEAKIKEMEGKFSAYPTMENLNTLRTEFQGEFKRLENIPVEFSKTDTRIELTDAVDDKYKNLSRFYTKK